MNKNTTVISLESITKDFRSRGNKNPLTTLWNPKWETDRVLDDLSFDITSGETVAFLGPNGAGKTTTTKIMTGLIKPTSGTAITLGYDPFAKDKAMLQRIGLVMGNRAGLNWDLTARNAFDMLGVIYRLDSAQVKSRVAELSKMLECDHRLDTQVRRMSLGERMKMEMIGSLLHSPEVLFLDEPTIGLDVQSKATLRVFLRSINDQGVTLILTSHDMDDVEEVCDRAIIISKGSKIFDGRLIELTERYGKYRYINVQLASGTIDKSEFKGIGTMMKSSEAGQLLRVKQTDLGKALQKLSSLDLLDLSIEAVPLEKVMRDLQ